MKAMATSATRPRTIIQIHILFELALLDCVVVCVGRVVCVVVLVVVELEVFEPLLCGAEEPVLPVFWASAGATSPAQARLRTSRHALRLLDS
jgi:hypothetical protein